MPKFACDANWSVRTALANVESRCSHPPPAHRGPSTLAAPSRCSLLLALRIRSDWARRHDYSIYYCCLRNVPRWTSLVSDQRVHRFGERHPHGIPGAPSTRFSMCQRPWDDALMRRWFETQWWSISTRWCSSAEIKICQSESPNAGVENARVEENVFREQFDLGLIRERKDVRSRGCPTYTAFAARVMRTDRERRWRLMFDEREWWRMCRSLSRSVTCRCFYQRVRAILLCWRNTSKVKTWDKIRTQGWTAPRSSTSCWQSSSATEVRSCGDRASYNYRMFNLASYLTLIRNSGRNSFTRSGNHDFIDQGLT